jgi:CubicO group peptidase (beta-lactamase class C family)
VFFPLQPSLGDIEKCVETTDSTIYEIVSITKLFIAIFVLKLLEPSKINLEDPQILEISKIEHHAPS